MELKHRSMLKSSEKGFYTVYLLHKTAFDDRGQGWEASNCSSVTRLGRVTKFVVLIATYLVALMTIQIVSKKFEVLISMNY